MADGLKNSALPRALSEVIADVADLVQKEMRLARTELPEKLSLKIQGGIWMGVAALLAGWKLVGVPFLLFGVAALLGSVAALLAGWTLVGVAFQLVGIAALLGGVALLYLPELPRRLVAWSTKRDDLAFTPDSDVRN